MNQKSAYAEMPRIHNTVNEKHTSALYTPHPISHKLFGFTNETMAAMSNAELSFVRIDERCVRYPYSSSLRKSLARLEAISTVCVDGITPDLQTMLTLETLEHPLDETQPIPSHLLTTIKNAEVREATLAAIRYERLISKISNTPRDAVLSEENLLKAHAYLRYGTYDHGFVHYRKQPYRISPSEETSQKIVYCPPRPEHLTKLMNDLFLFARDNTLSPVTQAAVAHFQLEAIHPFKTVIDRTGRAFVHGILRKRSFYEHLIPPIALIPAMDVKHHAQVLLPYRTGQVFTQRNETVLLDMWVLHCARCVALSTQLTSLYMNGIFEIVEKWKSKIGEYRQGSAIDIMLQELPGRPLVSVASTMELTGKSFSAANEAIGQLTDKGILRPIRSVQRNRLFEASEITDMEQTIINRAIPASIEARESFCEQ